ncbi:MAG: ABC transporter ATP-binding protein [Clostridia bacterium]|nr:ABC transporter ATP-binding protein [Clostridia bacterium]
MENLLQVRNLKTSFLTPEGEITVLNGISFSVEHGEILGIVGESGSGKSVTALSMIKVLDGNGKITQGDIFFNRKNIVELNERDMQNIRGTEIGMIFQDPKASLNPLLTIGTQLKEVLIKHGKFSKQTANEKAIELLESVGINDAVYRMRQYPSELSGGMCQRIAIAIALACGPKLLIADEPTSSLDMTIQAQIIQLIKEIKQKTNMSILFITHDLKLAAGLCSRMLVMYGGSIMEMGSSKDVFGSPKHPYTKALVRCMLSYDVRDKYLCLIEEGKGESAAGVGGCVFYSRCKDAFDLCCTKAPHLKSVGEGHYAACWLAGRESGGEAV